MLRLVLVPRGGSGCFMPFQIQNIIIARRKSQVPAIVIGAVIDLSIMFDVATIKMGIFTNCDN